MSKRNNKHQQAKKAFMRGEQVYINMTDLRMNSANKENKSMEHVRTGTGAHKNKKAYSRKQKHREKY